MGSPSHETSRELEIGWRDRLVPGDPAFLALAGAALAVSVALSLLAASLGFPSETNVATWIVALGGSISALTGIILVARSFTRWRPALLYGSLAYLWPLPILLIQWLLAGGSSPDAGAVLRTALMWPSLIVQGAIACPLGLPCPLGR